MPKISYRTPNAQDIALLASKMRDSDRAEITASSGADVQETLRASVAISIAPVAVEIDGELAGIFGDVHVAQQPDKGVVWFIATPLWDKHPLLLTKEAAKIMRGWFEKYTVLFNYVDARNTKSIRWLKVLGFTFNDAVPFGVEQRPFHYFEKVKHV